MKMFSCGIKATVYKPLSNIEVLEFSIVIVSIVPEDSPSSVVKDDC